MCCCRRGRDGRCGWEVRIRGELSLKVREHSQFWHTFSERAGGVTFGGVVVWSSSPKKRKRGEEAVLGGLDWNLSFVFDFIFACPPPSICACNSTLCTPLNHQIASIEIRSSIAVYNYSHLRRRSLQPSVQHHGVHTDGPRHGRFFARQRHSLHVPEYSTHYPPGEFNTYGCHCQFQANQGT